MPRVPKPKVVTDGSWKVRYQQAWHDHFKRTHAVAYADGHFHETKYPKVSTANGLTAAICNFVDWMGGVGNRISVSGRLVEHDVNMGMGRTVSVKKFITSSTKKGTGDTDLLLPNGKTIKVEVKVGRDTPSPNQLKMQAKVRRAGGVYEFVGDMNRFYYLYDLHTSPELFR